MRPETLHDLVRQKHGGAPPAEVRVVTRDRARRWGLLLDEDAWALAVETAADELSATHVRRGARGQVESIVPGWLAYQGAEGRDLDRRPTLVLYPGTWGAVDDFGRWEDQGAAVADQRVDAWLRQLLHPFAEGPRYAAELVLEYPRDRILALFAPKVAYYVRGAEDQGADGELVRAVAEDAIERGFRAELRRLAGMAPEPGPAVRDVGGTGPGGCANAFTASVPAGDEL